MSLCLKKKISIKRSNFTHLFMSIPTSNIAMHDIETMLSAFLWAGKPVRVSWRDICKRNLKGGLRMINESNFETYLARMP